MKTITKMVDIPHCAGPSLAAAALCFFLRARSLAAPVLRRVPLAALLRVEYALPSFLPLGMDAVLSVLELFPLESVWAWE